MKSKSPFRQDKCTVAWEKWTAKYDSKEETKGEKGEFYCDNGKIKMRPAGDDDIPYTDAEIKAMKEKNNKPEFGKKEKSTVEK